MYKIYLQKYLNDDRAFGMYNMQHFAVLLTNFQQF